MVILSRLSGETWDRFLAVATPTLMLGAAGLASLAGGGGQSHLALMVAGASGFLLIGLILGLAMLLAPRWLRPLIIAIALVVSLDIAFGWLETVVLFVHEWLPGVLQTPRRILMLGLGIGGPIGLVYVLRDRALPVFFATSLAFAVSSFFLPAGAIPRIDPLVAENHNPAPLGRVIIHVLLDSHIGPAGIPDSRPGGREMKQELADFYRARGFRIYSSAYTPYPATPISMPAFLSLKDPRPEKITHEELLALWGQPFAWFSNFRRQGYAIYAYSIGNTADLCAPAQRGNFSMCERYGGDGLNFDLWKEHPYRRMLRYIGRRSMIVQSLCAFEPSCNDVQWIDTGRNLRSMDVMKKSIETIRYASGDIMIFVHVLLPHSPQLLGADCRPDLPFPNGEIPPNLFFRRYFGQVRCTERYIDQLQTALKSRGALQNATIIVQADHGVGPYLQSVDSNIWRTTWHSALFAIRAPGVAPGMDNGFYRIQSLLKSVATGQPPVEGDGQVWDLDLALEPVLARMDRSQLSPPR